MLRCFVFFLIILSLVSIINRGLLGSSLVCDVVGRSEAYRKRRAGECGEGRYLRDKAGKCSICTCVTLHQVINE